MANILKPSFVTNLGTAKTALAAIRGQTQTQLKLLINETDPALKADRMIGIIDALEVSFMETIKLIDEAERRDTDAVLVKSRNRRAI